MNKIDNFIICDDNYHQACKTMFKLLNCNLLWIFSLDNNALNMLVTEQSLVEHYWNKKYYLQDPNFKSQSEAQKSSWKISLGTDVKAFSKNGFLYDLCKMFHVQEFVSIERKIGNNRYCFRFFTQNNRFVFIGKLLNDMPIIKCFINELIKKFTLDVGNRPGLCLSTVLGKC